MCTVCVLIWSLLGVKKSLGYARIGLFLGFNSKFPPSIPTPFICGVPPPPPPGSELIQSSKQGSFYKFLAVMENIKQEDHLVLKGAAKVLLQRMSVTRTNPLSDNNKKLASLAFNQFTLPVLPWYWMWTQVWPIADLQQLQDREVRKVIVDVQSRGKHHLGSTELSCTFLENSEEEALSQWKKNINWPRSRWWSSCTVIQTPLCRWLEGMKRTQRKMVDGR